MDLGVLSREQIAERVRQIKVPRPKDTAVDRVLETAREIMPSLSPAQLKRLENRLKADQVFESVLKKP